MNAKDYLKEHPGASLSEYIEHQEDVLSRQKDWLDNNVVGKCFAWISSHEVLIFRVHTTPPCKVQGYILGCSSKDKSVSICEYFIPDTIFDLPGTTPKSNFDVVPVGEPFYKEIEKSYKKVESFVSEVSLKLIENNVYFGNQR